MPIIEPSLLERRLYEAFDVFDNARSGEVDVRDLGTIIRALGKIHNIRILIIFLFLLHFYVFLFCRARLKFFYII